MLLRQLNQATGDFGIDIRASKNDGPRTESNIAVFGLVDRLGNRWRESRQQQWRRLDRYCPLRFSHPANRSLPGPWTRYEAGSAVASCAVAERRNASITVHIPDLLSIPGPQTMSPISHAFATPR